MQINLKGKLRVLRVDLYQKAFVMLENTGGQIFIFLYKMAENYSGVQIHFENCLPLSNFIKTVPTIFMKLLYMNQLQRNLHVLALFIKEPDSIFLNIMLMYRY